MKKLFVSICLIFLLSSSAWAANALVWNPGSKATTSANAIKSALEANGVSPVTINTSATLSSLTSYSYIFICLGVNPNTYVLSSSADGTSISNLIAYLNQGGKVYMEGGDTWAYDFPTSLHGYFYIYGEADGLGDLAAVTASFCGGESSSAYGVAQNYIDRLAPREGASVFFTNSNPAYACGIGYDNSVYRTLGVSFQFSGWDSGGRNALMASILQFFNNGCSAGKPAPLAVQAFEGYDGAVPLLWDAPPGQAPLDAGESRRPSMLFASASLNDQGAPQRIRPGRKIEDRVAAAVAQPQMQIAGYQADEYNIYRAPAAAGPYSLIASNVDKQYYRDQTVTNGVEVFYKIKAVYNGVEGAFSPVVSATPQADGWEMTAPWKFNTPVINGQIQPDEWSNAQSVVITRPGVSQPVTAYVFNDDQYLYLAVDDAADPSMSIDDQIGVYFDQNLNLRWGASSSAEEGNFWIYNSPSGVRSLYRGLRGWWPFEITWAEAAEAAGVEASMSAAAGHVQYEARIDLSASALDAAPGSSVGIYLYSHDAGNAAQTTGAWPSAVTSTLWRDAWMAPAVYGVLLLGEAGPCPWIDDDETVVATGTFRFNEFGDGRTLDLNVSELNAGGSVNVRQTNGCLQNPINPNYINTVWTVTPGDADIQAANLTFNYNGADESARNENRLKVHRRIGTTWQYEGGTVNSAANQVTANVDAAGEFALFERDHVLLSVKLFLHGAYLSGGLMRTELAANSFIPTTSTLSDARQVNRIPAGVVDWVSLELRSTPDGAPVSRRSFFLKANGDVVDWDGTTTTLSMPDAVNGSYYIVVRHRNHLAAMSAAPVALNGNSATLYDFTVDASAFYGNDAKQLESGVFGLYTGDANGNGQVQNDDKNDFWKAQVGLGGYHSADFNLNGQVQNDDKNDFWKLNVGKGTQIP